MFTSFVYAPKSGSRVFSFRHHDDMSVVCWRNGSRHVIGRHVRLTYVAAEAGRHWRTDATNTATAIVQAVGGIAWDDRGTINLAVPAAWAVEADRKMRAAAEAVFPDYQHECHASLLVAEGVAAFEPIGDADGLGSLRLMKTRVEPAPLGPIGVLAEDGGQDVKIVAVLADGRASNTVLAKAPADWGTPAAEEGGLLAYAHADWRVGDQIMGVDRFTDWTPAEDGTQSAHWRGVITQMHDNGVVVDAVYALPVGEGVYKAVRRVDYLMWSTLREEAMRAPYPAPFPADGEPCDDYGFPLGDQYPEMVEAGMASTVAE